MICRWILRMSKVQFQAHNYTAYVPTPERFDNLPSWDGVDAHKFDMR